MVSMLHEIPINGFFIVSPLCSTFINARGMPTSNNIIIYLNLTKKDACSNDFN